MDDLHYMYAWQDRQGHYEVYNYQYEEDRHLWIFVGTDSNSPLRLITAAAPLPAPTSLIRSLHALYSDEEPNKKRFLDHGWEDKHHSPLYQEIAEHQARAFILFCQFYPGVDYDLPTMGNDNGARL